MKKPVFTGSGVAIVTPFRPDNTVNYDKLGELIDFQIENHTDAIVIVGTTGESATLSDREHLDVIEFAVKKTAGRVPVVAGAGSNDTEYALGCVKHAGEVGADAVLIVTPYYNKTTQAGLVKHYHYIADRSDLPIIVYNVPSRTGLNILPETYKELAKHPHIVATKEANGNIEALIKTRYLCGDDLLVYSGEDSQTLPILSLGGQGVISVLANVMPRQTHDICQLFFDGEAEQSRDLHIRLYDLMSKLFIETNPIPVKAAMNLMGMDVGHTRMPLFAMEEKNLAILKKAMIDAGIAL